MRDVTSLKPTTSNPAFDAEFHHFREFLTLALEGTAEWRSGLRHRFPNDARNEDAARELFFLAETVKDIPDALIKKYISFNRADGYGAAEREGELLRSIGFHRDYKDAADFVRDLVA